MPDVTTLDSPKPSKGPQAAQAPSTCAHPPAQECQPRSLHPAPSTTEAVSTLRLSLQPHSGASSHWRPEDLRTPASDSGTQGGSWQPYFQADGLSLTLFVSCHPSSGPRAPFPPSGWRGPRWESRWCQVLPISPSPAYNWARS